MNLRGLCLLGALVVGAYSSGCGPDHKAAEAPIPAQTARGLLLIESGMSAEDSTVALRTDLQELGLGVPIDLDHRAGAAAAGLEMPASNVFVFGNPALGTPLMQENIVVALDLPLKMLVSENASGRVQITYEAPDHLRRRFSLSGADAQLQRAAGALARLASAASGKTAEATQGDAREIQRDAGLQLTVSSLSPADALAALVGAIDDNPMLGVFTQIDHQAAAEGIGLSLDFATVVVFGSAAVGTPLMLSQDSIGLDLPLKILVAQRDEETILVYSEPAFLALRHGGLPSQQARLDGMTAALTNLVAAATGPTNAVATGTQTP